MSKVVIVSNIINGLIDSSAVARVALPAIKNAITNFADKDTAIIFTKRLSDNDDPTEYDNRVPSSLVKTFQEHQEEYFDFSNLTPYCENYITNNPVDLINTLFCLDDLYFREPIKEIYILGARAFETAIVSKLAAPSAAVKVLSSCLISTMALNEEKVIPMYNIEVV